MTTPTTIISPEPPITNAAFVAELVAHCLDRGDTAAAARWQSELDAADGRDATQR